MKFNMKKTVLGVVIASMLALPSAALSADFHIAVASNFNDCLGALITEYTTNSNSPGFGLDITKRHTSSGILEGEIRANANTYQLFLSADTLRPAALVNDALAKNNTQYAQGFLVAYSITKTSLELGNYFGNGNYPANSVAVANPELAPYGLASQQAFDHKGDTNLWDGDEEDWEDNFYFNPSIFDTSSVNIAGPLTMVENGTKVIGLVSLGQVIKKPQGAYSPVPSHFYNPILQNGCVIKQAGGSYVQAAENFFTWMKTNNAARGIISSYGYN